MGNGNSNERNDPQNLDHPLTLNMHGKNIHDSFLRAIFNTLYVTNKHHGNDFITFENKNNCFRNLLRSWRGFENTLNTMLADESISIEKKEFFIDNMSHKINIFRMWVANHGVHDDRNSAFFISPINKSIPKKDELSRMQKKQLILIQKGIHNIYTPSIEPMLDPIRAFKASITTKLALLRSFQKDIEYANEMLLETRYDQLKERYIHAEKNAKILIKELSSYTYFSDDTLSFKITSEPIGTHPIRSDHVYNALVYIYDIKKRECRATANRFYSEWFSVRNDCVSVTSDIINIPMIETLASKKRQFFEQSQIKPSQRNIYYNPQELEAFRNEFNRVTFQTEAETGFVKKMANGQPMAQRMSKNPNFGALYDLFYSNDWKDARGNDIIIGFVDPGKSEFYATVEDYYTAYPEHTAKSKAAIQKIKSTQRTKENPLFKELFPNGVPDDVAEAWADDNLGTNGLGDKHDKVALDPTDINGSHAKNHHSMVIKPSNYAVIGPKITATPGGNTMRMPIMPGGSGFFDYVVVGAFDDFVQLPAKTWDFTAPKVASGFKTLKGALVLDGPANGFNMSDVVVMMAIDNHYVLGNAIKNGQNRRYAGDIIGFLSGSATMYAETLYRYGGGDMVKQGFKYHQLRAWAAQHGSLNRQLIRNYAAGATALYTTAKVAGIQGTKAALTYTAVKTGVAAKTIGAPVAIFYIAALGPQFFQSNATEIIDGKEVPMKQGIDWTKPITDPASILNIRGVVKAIGESRYDIKPVDVDPQTAKQDLHARINLIKNGLKHRCYTIGKNTPILYFSKGDKNTAKILIGQ